MQFSVTFRHMDASEAVRSYAREKIEKIKKYVPDPIFAHFVVGTNRGYQHAVDVHIQLHNGLAIKGHESSEDMYASIDLVMDKIERQVRRYKERMRHHKAREGLSELWEHVIEAASNGHADQTPEPTNGTPTTTAPVSTHKITKTVKYTAQALHPEEAVMQLDLAHQQFMVFRNADTGQIAVVYRRDDGDYGLIDTTPVS